MTPLDLNWGCCSVSNEDDNYTLCPKCKKAYHHLCLFAGKNKPKLTKVDKDWLCPRCRESTPKASKNDNTPFRSAQNITLRPTKKPTLSQPSKNDSPVTREEMREIMEEILLKHMEDFKKQFCGELLSVKEEIRSINKAMDYMGDQVEDMLKKYKENNELIKNLQKHEYEMQLNITNLTARINLLEQNARCKNIEIQCVPEKKTENLVGIVKELSKVVGLDLKDENIVHVTRTAKLNPEVKRPRSIIVELNNTRVRDSFLAAVSKFNKPKSPNDKLNSSHVGFTGPTSAIYVMEHLSPANKSLHATVRQAAKEKGYKYVWVRGGRIFMRKNDDSAYIYIKDNNVLANLK